ncbi:MAG: hypothetical protein GC136_02320 [Alphaproteobacteria bacterium]|nr:hypothetical protein [Alphaproteobacteria bacterium]
MKKLLAAAFLPLAIAGSGIASAQDAPPPVVDTRSPEDQARWPLFPPALPPCTENCVTSREIPLPSYGPFEMPAVESLVRVPLAVDEGHVGFFTRTGIENETPIRLLETGSQVRTVAGDDMEAIFGNHHLRGTFFRVTCDFPADVPENRRHTIDFLGGGTEHKEVVRVEPDPENEGDFIQWERTRGYSVRARTGTFSCYVDYLPLEGSAPLTPR